MKNNLILIILSLLLLQSLNCFSDVIPKTGQAIDIDFVWGGHPVEFDLCTYSNYQFVAFFDSNRWLTVAQRNLQNTNWNLVKLPSQLGWDSHNYVALELDPEGYIHVSGNMHNVPLIYFKSTNAFDINSFVQIKEMIGKNEKSCTQPQFIRNGNKFIFTYRDGGSGNGKRIYNIYNIKNKKWKRFLNTPLLSGEGKRNAYHYGPIKGPNGYFHLTWVWRDNPDCSSNHDLSYARSKDLLNWETSSGKKLELPITFKTAEIVDPVAVGQGLFNANITISFDDRKRPIITYHKFDDEGNTQLYQARFEKNIWKIYKTTNWKYRWDFGGRGCIVEKIKFKPMWKTSNNNMVLWFRHVLYGKRLWLINNKTLKPVAELVEPLRPRNLEKVFSDFSGMKVQWKIGHGKQPNSRSKFWLRWETLDYNQDKQRNEALPNPSMLKLYNLKNPSTINVRKICLTNNIEKAVDKIKEKNSLSKINLLKNGNFDNKLENWSFWQSAKTLSNTVKIISVSGKKFKNAVRIENPMKKLVGIQQRVRVISNAVYKLSGIARSLGNDKSKIFGGRIALWLPPQKEKQIVWMSEYNNWWKKDLIFTNQVTGIATVYVHMGYGGVASTGEFTNIRLELINAK